MRGYVVHKFMINKLKLKKTELQVFALIFKYSREGDAFWGSNGYIAREIGVSKRSVTNALASLCEKELIIRYPNERGLGYSYKYNDKKIINQKYIANIN